MGGMMGEIAGLIIEAVWWTLKLFVAMVVGMMLATFVAAVILAVRKDLRDPRDDDEEHADAMIRYYERKGERERARIVRRELRRKRIRERRDGEIWHGPHAGDVVPPKEDTEGELLSGKNKKGD